MTKALFLIIPDGFRDEEYSIPKKILEEHGIDVITSSTIGGKLTGKRGLTTATVDILLKDTKSTDYDTILVVGGGKTFWHNAKVIQLLQEMYKQGKPIAAICSSAVLPAQAGLMTGKRGTAFPGEPEITELKKLGVIYQANPVEVDGQIITSDGPDSAAEMAQQILKLLNL